MQGRSRGETPTTWEDVLTFLHAKRSNMEKLERGYSQRRTELEVN